MKKKLLLVLLISACLLTIVGCGKKDEKKEDSYKIEFAGVNITPGETLDLKKINKEYDKSEVPDCALGGKGLVYTFEELEISTNEENKIYSVYFIDPNMKTKEGIALGDEVSAVKKAYGDKEIKDGVLKYSKGKVEINFNISNDVVDSIEYLLLS